METEEMKQARIKENKEKNLRCKNCDKNPRQNGSSRCKECSDIYKNNSN